MKKIYAKVIELIFAFLFACINGEWFMVLARFASNNKKNSSGSVGKKFFYY